MELLSWEIWVKTIWKASSLYVVGLALFLVWYALWALWRVLLHFIRRRTPDDPDQTA